MPDDRDRPGAPRRPRVRGTNGSHLSETPTVRTRFDDVSDAPTVRTRFDEASATPTVRMRFDDPSDEPVDLVAVQADDELIDALASGMSVSAPGLRGYDADDHVVALLAAWRAEVEADPLPPLVDVDVAVARVKAASRPTGRRLRLVAPIAAAAVVLLGVGGYGYSAGLNAQPDDGIAWQIARVVDSDRVESVLAAERVEERIAEAKEALRRGEPEVAAQALAAAAQDLQVVRPEENASALTEVQSFLEAKVAETPPGTPVAPDAPLRSDPTRPVPPGATPGVPAAPPAPTPGPAVVSVPAPALQPAPQVSVPGAAEPAPGVPSPQVPSGPDPSSAATLPVAPSSSVADVPQPEPSTPPASVDPTTPTQAPPTSSVAPSAPVPGADGGPPPAAPVGTTGSALPAAGTATGSGSATPSGP